MAQRSRRADDANPLETQLEAIKRLAILQLLASGVQSTHIAKALGVHSSAISRMMPAREIKKLAQRPLTK